MADRFYVPLVKGKQTKQENAPQIPPYEDAGVKFQGFYKKKVSESDYILKPQIPYEHHVFISSEANDTKTFLGQRFCVTSISLYPDQTLSVGLNYVIRILNGDLLQQYFVPFTAERDGFQILFDPPLILNNGSVVSPIVVGGAWGSGTITATLWGFLEEI